MKYVHVEVEKSTKNVVGNNNKLTIFTIKLPKIKNGSFIIISVINLIIYSKMELIIFITYKHTVHTITSSSSKFNFHFFI